MGVVSQIIAQNFTSVHLFIVISFSRFKMSSSSPRFHMRTPINADGVSLSTYTLGIVYSMIARGNVILVHYACCHGNFSEVIERVLINIPFEKDGKLTYAAGE